MKLLSILVLALSCFAVYSKSVSKEDSKSAEIAEVKEALEAARVAVIKAQRSLEKAESGRSLAGASVEAQGPGKCQYCADSNSPLAATDVGRNAQTSVPNVPSDVSSTKSDTGSSDGTR